jgi:hypothetical protein
MAVKPATAVTRSFGFEPEDRRGIVRSSNLSPTDTNWPNAGTTVVWQQVSEAPKTGLLSAGPVSTVRSATPAQQAAAILDFLQAPGGRTGTITATELRQIHAEVCFDLELEPIGWTAVGCALRKLIGEGRTYQRINGEQVRVYRIPPRAAEASARAV